MKKATEQGRAYAVAFVDMRMPPGWDGVQTIGHLWRSDPRLQVVICTAYADGSWDDILALSQDPRLTVVADDAAASLLHVG